MLVGKEATRGPAQVTERPLQGHHKWLPSMGGDAAVHFYCIRHIKKALHNWEGSEGRDIRNSALVKHSRTGSTHVVTYAGENTNDSCDCGSMWGGEGVACVQQ